ncbi:hypothetical protein MRX96_001181 [Rhipicephalus microplus]
MNVPEAEDAARKTGEAGKRVGLTEAIMPSNGDGLKGEGPTLNHSGESASGSKENVEASQVRYTASSIGYTSKSVDPSA